MCDFSPYGGRSDEWVAVERRFPPLPPLPTDEQALLHVRDMMNKAQEEAVALEMEPLAARVSIRDHAIPTRDGRSVEARSFRPARPAHADGGDPRRPLPVYMHMHGGGFLFGTVSSDEAVCARIASGVGAVVLNVNYRHTPEATYPTAWEDAEDAFAWLHANVDDLGGDAQRVVLGGTSAGAHLAAILTLGKHLNALGPSAQACPPIAGQVLMIPLLAHKDCHGEILSRLKDPSVSSYEENADAPILPTAVIDTFLGLLKIDNPDARDLKLNPANASAEQVKGLPPTTLGIAGLDPLRDEGLLYAKTLSEAGWVPTYHEGIFNAPSLLTITTCRVPTTTHVFKGLPHGFRRFKDVLSEAKRWDQVVDNGIKWALERPTATGQFLIQEE